MCSGSPMATNMRIIIKKTAVRPLKLPPTGVERSGVYHHAIDCFAFLSETYKPRRNKLSECRHLSEIDAISQDLRPR
jgi:hypothetical protein